MKKASANMWWIIIGAVIALVVMIVLMVIFTSKSGAIEMGLLDCESKGGNCLHDESPTGEKDCKKYGSISYTFNCKLPNKVCCFTGNQADDTS